MAILMGARRARQHSASGAPRITCRRHLTRSTRTMAKNSGSSASDANDSASGSSSLGSTVSSASNAGDSSGSSSASGITSPDAGTTSSTSSVTSTDVTGGLGDDAAVGRANAAAGRVGVPVDAFTQGNANPEPGSLDAKRAEADRAELIRTAAEAGAAAALASQGNVQRMEIVPSGSIHAAPTRGLDTTIPGGKTMRGDGQLQNAHGMEIDDNGIVLDTPFNRDADPGRQFIGRATVV